MKKITQIGFVALATLLLFATACKKNPSAKLYKTWTKSSIEMPDADSVTLAQYNASDITYTFSKGGTYTYSVGSQSGEGTFDINEEGTSMSTTEEGKTDMYSVMLTETTLKLTKGSESMMFTAK